MDLLVSVVNQQLRLETNVSNLIYGTQEFIRFVFSLTGDWDTFTTFAQFQQDGNVYNKYLDSDNSVYLPAEIHTGKCNMLLCGNNGTNVAVTNFLTLTIDDNIYVVNAENTEITQSLYDQLVENVQTQISTFANRVSDLEVASAQHAKQVDLDAEIERAKSTERQLADLIDGSEVPIGTLAYNIEVLNEPSESFAKSYQLKRMGVDVGEPIDIAISEGEGHCSAKTAKAGMASGFYSFAQGFNNIATRKCQHVFGEFNIGEDDEIAESQRGEFVEIVGNGEDEDNRSNARTLDWEGNEKLAGNITALGGSLILNETEMDELTLMRVLLMLDVMFADDIAY